MNNVFTLSSGRVRPGTPGSSGGAMYMTGMKEAMDMYKQVAKKLATSSVKGLIMSAAFIRRQTETTPPFTPVDYGNLRASWFIVSAKGNIQGGPQMGSKTFKGPKASQIKQDYQQTVSECQAKAKTMSASGIKEFVIFGYGTRYSGFVHEMIGVNFHRPGSGPKWLEFHIKRNLQTIMRIIATECKIPKGKKVRISKSQWASTNQDLWRMNL